MYHRILLKLSGEALMGDTRSFLAPPVIKRMAQEVKELIAMGVQVGMVIGGGNILRGARLAEAGINRVTGDYMGMLGTVINALAMQDVLEAEGVHARVMSAFGLEPLCETYLPRRALRQLDQGRVVVMAAGTGNPYFTTDSAAALRGIEIGADAVLKATRVDGVYSADPERDPNAELYRRLTYDEVLERRLAVMDGTAIVMCRDHGMPLRVFNMSRPGTLKRVVQGEDEGTLVEREDATSPSPHP